MKTLKQWNWCIDYSKAIGQKDAEIAPRFFASRQDARLYNYEHSPKGVIRRVILREIKK